MRSRVIWRRSATAIGTYVAAGLGFLTTVVATRELGLHDYAQFAAVYRGLGLLPAAPRPDDRGGARQVRLPLHGVAALGPAPPPVRGRARLQARSAASSRCSRSCALAPFAKQVWGTGGVFVPMLIVSTIALAQAPENVAAGAIILRGRYDIRGCVPRGLDGAAARSGSRSAAGYGVAGAALGMVVAQVVATIAISVAGLAAFRRFPKAPSEPLGEDVRGARGVPLLLDARLLARLGAGDARNLARPDRRPDRPGRLLPERPGARDGLRGALGPGAPRDADRADPRLRGRPLRPGASAMLKRYVAATGALMLVAVPILWIADAVPDRRSPTGPTFRAHATDAARLVLARRRAPARLGLDEVVPRLDRPPGAPRDRPVDRDRRLRPAAPRSSPRAGARPARRARCSSRRSSSARSGRDHPPAAPGSHRAMEPVAPLKVLIVSGIWPPDVGGPASHAPEVAAFLRGPRARRRGRDHRRRGAGAGGLPGALGEPLAAARASGTSPWSSSSPGCARHADVVYTTGMLGRSSLGSLRRANAVRDQAHRRPRLRARAPLGAQRRLARAVPAHARRDDAAAPAHARPRRPPCRARRDALGVPPRARDRLGRAAPTG